MLTRGHQAKRSTPFIALVLLAGLAWPAASFALGVAGFDVSRPSAKNPDGAFHFNLESGQSLEDSVVLKNTTSDTVQNLRVYIADGMATTNGGIALRGREEKKTGLAKWISIDSSEELTLAPGEERTITFRLRVPWSSKSKERIAGLVVERATAIKEPANKQFMINVLPRAAILISQRLPGPALERLKIVDFSQTWAKNRNKILGLAIKNTGNIHLRPKGRIDIYDMFGSKADTIRYDQMATIFPETTSHIKSEWKNTPAIGFFTAKALIYYGQGKSDERRITFLIFPWWVLAFLPVLWFIARGQRKRRAAKRLKKLEAEKAAGAAFPLEAPEETVEKIEPETPAPRAAATKVVKARTRAAAPAKTPKKPAAAKAEKPAKAKKAPVKKAPVKKAPVKKAKPAKD